MFKLCRPLSEILIAIVTYFPLDNTFLYPAIYIPIFSLFASRPDGGQRRFGYGPTIRTYCHIWIRWKFRWNCQSPQSAPTSNTTSLTSTSKKGKKTVKRKHRKECQKLYPWARSCVTEGKKEMTYCTWCSPVGTTQVQMACKLSALRQHNKTQKHHRSAPGQAEGQGDVTKFFRKKKEKRAVKVAEVKLAAFSAVHTSFRYDFKLRIFIIFSP